MKRSHKIAVGLIASISLGLAVGAAYAHPGPMGAGMGPGMMSGMGPGMMGGMGPGMMGGMGPGMMRGMGPGASDGFRGPMGGPMAGPMQHDDATFADMRLVHDMLGNHERIKRTVTNLPNGIRTVTESGDPQVAQAIKAHVASMTKRLSDGREFNMFSRTLPTLFENKDKIQTKIEMTENGSVVTQTSSDSTVVAALQAHAGEVSELARDGMVAMMRSARANMGMTPRGPRAGIIQNFGPAAESHTH